MSVSPAPLDVSVVISKLRAAGCVFAEDEAALLMSTARDSVELATMIDRRVAGLPLEHVLGWAEFGGLRVAVDPGVFVPRRRTEFLARQAALLAGEAPRGPRTTIVDLCCGAGALGVALATAIGHADVDLHASDIDPAAVRCAARNVAGIGGRVYEGDLFEPLPRALRGAVDVLLANVPYVPSGEIGLLPPEARDHEARVALDGGADGLDVLRRVTAEAPRWLAPRGHLLVETSERQASPAVAIMTGQGLTARVFHCEDTNATVVAGTMADGGPVAASGPVADGGR